MNETKNIEKLYCDGVEIKTKEQHIMALMKQYAAFDCRKVEPSQVYIDPPFMNSHPDGNGYLDMAERLLNYPYPDWRDYQEYKARQAAQAYEEVTRTQRAYAQAVTSGSFIITTDNNTGEIRTIPAPTSVPVNLNFDVAVDSGRTVGMIWDTTVKNDSADTVTLIKLRERKLEIDE